MRITRALLIRRRACSEQVSIFAAEWPDGVLIDEASARRAEQLGLDLCWAALKLLPARGRLAYETAVAEGFQEANARAARAERALQATYETAWALYKPAMDAAKQDYSDRLEAARLAYLGDRSTQAFFAYERAEKDAYRDMQAALAGPQAAFEALLAPARGIHAAECRAIEAHRAAIRRAAFLAACEAADTP